MRNLVLSALLGVGALVALAIASAILFAPVAFYAAYGIDPAGNVALLNEIKAPALLILVAGLGMLGGLVRPAWRQRAIWVGGLFYLSFGLSRLLAIALDGAPPSGLLWAMAIELTLGGIFAFALWQKRWAD